MDKENKTKVAKVYLTPSEKTKWQEKATMAGLSMSDFVRDAVDGTEIIAGDFKEELKEVNNQINRIGVNLNQLTKIANTYSSEIKASDLIEVIADFREELDNIYDAVLERVRENAN